MRIAVHPDNVICSVSREKISLLRTFSKDFLTKIEIMRVMPFYEHQIKRCGSAKTFSSYPEIFDARKRTPHFQRKKNCDIFADHGHCVTVTNETCRKGYVDWIVDLTYSNHSDNHISAA